MTQLSRTALKAFFQTGLKPTQSNFADLIDSVPNFVNLDPGTWLSKHILYSDISYAGTSYNLAFLSHAAKQFIDYWIVYSVTAFRGGTISACTMQPFSSVGGYPLAGVRDLYVAGGNFVSLRLGQFPYYACDMVNPWNSILTFTATGGNLNTLSQGEAYIYYKLTALTA
jgi:hypothetical protein